MYMITAIIPLNNELETLNRLTGKTYYIKLTGRNSVSKHFVGEVFNVH